MDININNVDEMLLDVLFQACNCPDLNGKEIIDNMCISAYEQACIYLTKKGYLRNINGRMYMVKK